MTFDTQDGAVFGIIAQHTGNLGTSVAFYRHVLLWPLDTGRQLAVGGESVMAARQRAKEGRYLPHPEIYRAACRNDEVLAGAQHQRMVWQITPRRR